MKLYSNAYSYTSRRCRAVATHLGVEVSVEEVDLGAGQHHEEAFVALNPNAKVPVLVDGDLVLWESLAIMFHLSVRGGGGLRGGGPHETADIHRWCVWTVSRFNVATNVFLHENMVKKFFNLGEPDADRLAATAPEVTACYEILDAQLKGRDFICGAGLTLADFALYPTFEQAGDIVLPSWATHQNIERWCERMAALPAFAIP